MPKPWEIRDLTRLSVKSLEDKFAMRWNQLLEFFRWCGNAPNRGVYINFLKTWVIKTWSLLKFWVCSMMQWWLPTFHWQVNVYTRVHMNVHMYRTLHCPKTLAIIYEKKMMDREWEMYAAFAILRVRTGCKSPHKGKREIPEQKNLLILSNFLRKVIPPVSHCPEMSIDIKRPLGHEDPKRTRQFTRWTSYLYHNL